MADTEQGEKETPHKFLDRLWEALHKFIHDDPKSGEKRNDLKDIFLTQSAPDISHKLLKQAFGPNRSFEKLLQLAQTVYYGRGYEEEKSRQKRNRQKTEAPKMAVRPVLK